MSTTSAPFGLVAANHPSGIVRPSVYSIASGYATGILANQPVKIAADGTIAAAAIGDRFIGTFQGVTWTDTNGKQQFSNQWTASTTGTNIQANVTRDPSIIYNIQANATMTVANIGEQYDFTTITAGSTTTGLSALMLNVASTAANASLQVIGLTPGPDNAWGDAFPIVQVRISEHQFVADVAAF
jgi:hypothetical protein